MFKEMSTFEKVSADDAREELQSREITSADVEKEIKRTQEVVREYMREDGDGYIIKIKKAINAGDEKMALEIKEEALESLEAQITFLESMEKPELDGMKNKLQAVVEYYKEKF